MSKILLECSQYFSRMRPWVFYIVYKFQAYKFQASNYNTFGDINFLLVKSVQTDRRTTDRQTDRRKAIHMSPPCISTGGLKN